MHYFLLRHSLIGSCYVLLKISLQKLQEDKFNDNFVTMKMGTMIDEVEDLPKQNHKKTTVENNNLQHQLIEEQSRKLDLLNKKIQKLEQHLADQNKDWAVTGSNLQQQEQITELDAVNEKIHNLEQNIQPQLSKLEERHQTFQCKLLEYEKQLHQECSDKVKLQEQLQKYNTCFESLEHQFARLDSLMTSISTKVDTLSPSWVVYPYEIKIDTKQEIGRGLMVLSMLLLSVVQKLLLNLCTKQFLLHTIYLLLPEKWTWLEDVAILIFYNL